MAEDAGSALDRELQLALLNRHRPELRYHPDERCVATSVEALLHPPAGIRRIGLRARDNTWVATTDAADARERLVLEMLRGEGDRYRADHAEPVVSAHDHLDF